MSISLCMQRVIANIEASQGDICDQRGQFYNDLREIYVSKIFPGK